jgi:hypothetical protein
MHSFMLLATAAAVILAGTATSDAASRKKPHASADRSATVAAKHKRHVTRPVAGRPWNQPWQGNQGWPTSVNDGSFSYGFGPGGSMR